MACMGRGSRCLHHGALRRQRAANPNVLLAGGGGLLASTSSSAQSACVCVCVCVCAGVASPRVNDNPFHRSEAEAKAAANKRRPPSASRKPPPVPTLAAPAAATVSPSEREIAAAQAQLEGEIRSDDPDEQLRDAIRAELAKMGITNVPAAMLEDEVKRIKKEQGGKPKTPEVRVRRAPLRPNSPFSVMLSSQATGREVC
jgi:hypothetical protein